MARQFAGILTSAVMGAALVGGPAVTAQADELELSASTALTTDYVFRGISQTGNNPAVQGSIDASYGIFYAGMWGSSIDFAPVEIDYYAGIAPEWMGISFDVGGLFYTYPGADDPGGDFNYFEVKAAASYTFYDSFTLGVANYYSPEFFGESGDANALELAGEYTFDTIFNFFDPSISALVGWQWIDENDTFGTDDYTYWNVGLTLGFMDNFAADIRYYDTDLSSGECFGGDDLCDGRVVGTLSASF
ncbi:MAG: TorF family putative porin [Pseudomonadota bacterium]